MKATDVYPHVPANWAPGLILMGALILSGACFRFDGNRRDTRAPFIDGLPMIDVLPALAAEANAACEGGRIPWGRDHQAYQIKIRGTVITDQDLARTVIGNYSYTLCRVAVRVDQVPVGQLTERELIFFVERPFPTRESGILWKALPAFSPGQSLSLKLRKGDERWIIVSVEP